MTGSLGPGRGAAWRSLPLGARTIVLGVINVTPDSVSGIGTDLDRAVAIGQRLVEAGADALDVGGESTRHGAVPVTVDQHLHRVVPALERLAATLSVPLSVATTKVEVARAALDAGASIVNDVSGLHASAALAEAVAGRGAALVLSHWARAVWGTTIPRGGDPVAALVTHLAGSAARARAAGVPADAIWLDPGLGFGKRAATSRTLIRHLHRLVALGYPVVVGPSRNGFIRQILHRPPAEDWEGAAALVALAIAAGAQVVRVHDVQRLARVARMTDAICERSPGHPLRPTPVTPPPEQPDQERQRCHAG